MLANVVKSNHLYIAFYIQYVSKQANLLPIVRKVRNIYCRCAPTAYDLWKTEWVKWFPAHSYIKRLQVLLSILYIV